MNKLLKEIKSNKHTVIAIAAFILLIAVSYTVYKFMIPNPGVPNYGNRLDGIEEVKISDSEMNSNSRKLEQNDIVKSANGSISGRTINFTMVIKKGTKSANAKALTTNVAELFSDKEKAFYDIQVFIENENNEEVGYPIIGYKNKNNKNFSFSAAKS